MAQTLIDALLTHAAARPHAPVLVEPARTTSYAELLDGARSGAAWLYANGVRPGHTIALLLDAKGDHARQAQLLCAVAWLGAPLLPVYAEIPAGERAVYAARFGARIVDPAEWPGTALAAEAPRGDGADQPFIYELSSGTTASPKVVLFTSAQYFTSMTRTAQCYRWTETERLVSALPWPTKVGLRSLVRMILVGGAVVNVPFPDTREALSALVAELRVTSIGSAPVQLRRLLASPVPAGWQAPPLRCLTTAGAPIGPHELEAVRSQITPNLHLTYGCSETGTLAHLAPEDPADAEPRLIEGIEGQALDAHGQSLGVGTAGVLRFRAAWFPVGYAANPLASAAHYRDGWFYPGDVGSIDAAGRVRLRGRSDDAINFGGVKLAPRDIEQVLEAHADVAEAAVVSVPDPATGEMPIAFVVLRRPTDDAALVAHCRARLSVLPQSIVKVSALPRNPEGKVLREELRRAYLDYKARG